MRVKDRLAEANWAAEERKRKFGQHLTPTEIEILTKLAYGDSVKVIARDTGRSARTVEVHVCRVRAKLGVKNITHAVVIALHRGLIEYKEETKETTT